MKRTNTSTLIFMAVGLMAAVAFAFYGAHDLAIAGASLGFMGIVGTPTGEIDSESTGDERLERDVESSVVTHRPDVFRIDTALRKVESEPLMAIEKEWEEVDEYPRLATADDGADVAQSAAGDASVVPLSVTGGTKEAGYFIPGDICRVIDKSTNEVLPAYSGKELYVTEASADANEITVKAFGNNGFLSQVPAIPASTKDIQIVRAGNAKSEKEGVGRARSMRPVQYKNYVHTFEKFISISKMRKKLKTYTSGDLVRNIRQSMYDFRLDMESQFFDGVGMKGYHPETEDRMYTMKGLKSFIKTNIIGLPSVGSITEDMFIDWGEKVAADSHGSQEKMFFVSPSLWSELNKINLISDTLQTRRMEKVLGGYVIRIQTGHCDLLIGVHKGFPELGKKRYGAILDFKHINKAVLEPMETTEILPEKSGGSRTEGKKYLETSTVVVRYEQTHAILA